MTQGVNALGRVYDTTKYFRTLELARTDRWKGSAMIGGKYVDETRMIMGHTASQQTVERMSFVIARFLLEAFDKEFPRVLRGLSRSTQRVIVALV